MFDISVCVRERERERVRLTRCVLDRQEDAVEDKPTVDKVPPPLAV